MEPRSCGSSNLLQSLLYLKTSSSWRATLALFWLLLLPNAPYIITDLIHLPKIGGAPLWFDTLMISSCAGTGLAFGYASIMQVHVLLLRSKFRIAGRMFVLSSFFLVGFGIYLGRFRRWNSMDLFQSPLLLMSDIIDRLVNPMSHPRTWGFTIGFGILLALGYALLLTFSRAIHAQSHSHLTSPRTY